MGRALLVCGLAALLGCGASGAGEPEDTGGGGADAGGGGGGGGGGDDDSDGGSGGVMPKPPEDIIELSCIDSAEQLRIAVSREFQSDNACYPEPGFDAVIVTLEVGAAEPGETVSFTAGGGGHAYVCPADESQPCQAIEEGQVVFETYSAEGASGTFSLDGGSTKGLFNALWCADSSGC